MNIETNTVMKRVLVTGAADFIGDALTESGALGFEAAGFVHDGTPSRLIVRAMEI
ncbi:hypothetical protein SAMN05444172_9144 [Burkholderia sp. GAS332]|nr:hypothetical protein SAMN05444172_9144 [Burkholderia sp. GAS332]